MHLFQTTYFKYGFTQHFGGGQSKIVPMTMYDPLTASRANRLAAWSYYDANYRASHLITDKDGNPMILAETPPDTATTIERMLALSADPKQFGSLSLSNALNTTIAKLADRSPSVEMLRDGGYAIRELAFNNRLQGKADPLLQQLFSVVQSVETSPQVEQNERARAVSLYLQYCVNTTNAPNTNVIAMLQNGQTPSLISNNLSNTNNTAPSLTTTNNNATH